MSARLHPVPGPAGPSSGPVPAHGPGSAMAHTVFGSYGVMLLAILTLLAGVAVLVATLRRRNGKPPAAPSDELVDAQYADRPDPRRSH